MPYRGKIPVQQTPSHSTHARTKPQLQPKGHPKMQHLLILGHTPANITPAYSHATWHSLFNIIHSHLKHHPKQIPVSSLRLGWETIAVEVAIRLNRPFVCHSIPPDQHPPTDWSSPDKMTWINVLADASAVHSTPWPQTQTNAVLALWNGKDNKLGRAILQLQRAGIPITNCWPQFEVTQPCP